MVPTFEETTGLGRHPRVFGVHGSQKDARVAFRAQPGMITSLGDSESGIADNGQSNGNCLSSNIQ